MSSMPASAITSASPSFWQVMPLAPAAICIRASIGLLWVLMWGRLATPAASQVAWMRAMLRSTRYISITATGVPYSRAILAARGVVIEYPSWSSLLDLFAQHFKLQPAVFRRGQFLLCRCNGDRSLVELLAVLAIEVRVVEKLLIFRDVGLQLGDRLWQRFERVLFVEIEPALRCRRRRGSLGLLLLFSCSRGLGGLALQIGAALRQHVAIAAGIFDPVALALRHDHGSYHTV